MHLFAEVSGKDLKPQYAETRQGDIRRSMLSNEKAKTGLGWEPKVSLKEGLANTYDYFATK